MRFLERNFKILRIFKNYRVLSGYGEYLYMSKGYDVFKVDVNSLTFEKLGSFKPDWLRRWSVKNKKLYRLTRAGFRTLIEVKDCYFGVVAKHIVRKCSYESDFTSVFKIKRGTRPMSLTATPDGKIVFGEYFSNPDREEVYIYVSEDLGKTWEIAYVFPRNTIRHIHRIIYDKFMDCFWILTGDYGDESMIACADIEFKKVAPVFRDGQQSRAVAMILEKDFILYATDTEIEKNYIYYVDRKNLSKKAVVCLPGSSMYAFTTTEFYFFSTAVEPSKLYYDYTTLWASENGLSWKKIFEIKKDRMHPKFFQYGNIILPDGFIKDERNVFVTPIATESFDLDTLVIKVKG